MGSCVKNGRNVINMRINYKTINNIKNEEISYKSNIKKYNTRSSNSCNINNKKLNKINPSLFPNDISIIIEHSYINNDNNDINNYNTFREIIEKFND